MVSLQSTFQLAFNLSETTVFSHLQRRSVLSPCSRRIHTYCSKLPAALNAFWEKNTTISPAADHDKFHLTITKPYLRYQFPLFWMIHLFQDRPNFLKERKKFLFFSLPKHSDPLHWHFNRWVPSGYEAICPLNVKTYKTRYVIHNNSPIISWAFKCRNDLCKKWHY